MEFFKSSIKCFLVLLSLSLVFSMNTNVARGQTDIGVIFVVHGGMDIYHDQYMWDAGVQQFSYDPNHPVYQLAIWNPTWWGLVMQAETSIKFKRKYEFEYPRIGGTDPFGDITLQQLADMEAELDANTYGINFEVDWAAWMCGDCVDHYPYPRFIYYGPDGPGVGTDCTYCGESEPEDVVLVFDGGTEAFTIGATLAGLTSDATATIDEVTVTSGSWEGDDAGGYISLSNISGSFQDNETVVDDVSPFGSATADGTSKWLNCDPDRYNVDGPVERLLQAGVSRIIMVDLTVGGQRFSKTYEAVEMTKRAIDDWNTAHATSIPYPIWVNDYSNLMERSYPLAPEGWTRTLGLPTVDNPVLLKSGPNPIVSDPDLVTLHREAIEAGMSATVSDAETGIIILNHALHDHNEAFDPKMDDTLVLNNLVKDQLLSLHPTMDPDNIIGARMGIKELNSENGLVERTRPMRGEDLGHQWLYESAKKLPGDEWGYLYWDALEYLKNRGVQHIVIGFTQIVDNSVLDMVEIPNQIGKEIGIKNWAQWGTWDFTNYPGVGHPFADYWGNWVNTDCGEEPCCFTMGGCGDPFRPYPPPRQKPLNQARDDMDPSLAYDLSDYGHLGYDPGGGAPDPGNPVQDQYTGTWAMYVPPNDDPRVGQLLANHVLNAAVNPLVYITNGNIYSVDAGESVTWEAHVVSGTPAYAYEWATNKNDTGWSVVSGETSATWSWTPGSSDEGVYDIRCKVTDSNTHTGEVVWEDFLVGDSDDDGVQDAEDNCPNHPNGPLKGICTQHAGDNYIVSNGQYCVDDTDCDPGEYCEKEQADHYPPDGNGIGDACDCEGDFNCSGGVDAGDVGPFLDDWNKRTIYLNPCTNEDPCTGDFNCSGGVDAGDVGKFLEDWNKRTIYSNPCPACAGGSYQPWCVYPE